MTFVNSSSGDAFALCRSSTIDTVHGRASVSSGQKLTQSSNAHIGTGARGRTGSATDRYLARGGIFCQDCGQQIAEGCHLRVVADDSEESAVA